MSNTRQHTHRSDTNRSQVARDAKNVVRRREDDKEAFDRFCDELDTNAPDVSMGWEEVEIDPDSELGQRFLSAREILSRTALRPFKLPLGGDPELETEISKLVGQAEHALAHLGYQPHRREEFAEACESILTVLIERLRVFIPRTDDDMPLP